MGNLTGAGVHKSSKEHISEIWTTDSLPLYRALLSRDGFKVLLGFVRFDDRKTSIESKTKKATPIRDIGRMLNTNLQKLML